MLLKSGILFPFSLLSRLTQWQNSVQAFHTILYFFILFFIEFCSMGIYTNVI
jgi:hypothetical protein